MASAAVEIHHGRTTVQERQTKPAQDGDPGQALFVREVPQTQPAAGDHARALVLPALPGKIPRHYEWAGNRASRRRALVGSLRRSRGLTKTSPNAPIDGTKRRASCLHFSVEFRIPLARSLPCASPSSRPCARPLRFCGSVQSAPFRAASRRIITRITRSVQKLAMIASGCAICAQPIARSWCRRARRSI